MAKTNKTKKPQSKQSVRKRISSVSLWKRIVLLCFVFVFAGVGSYFLWHSSAYAPGDELQAKYNAVFSAPLAKRVLLSPDGSYGYTLDGYGGIHPFITYSTVMPIAPKGSAYWSGWDIARDFVISKWDPVNGPDGYTLDGFGGVHAFGKAPAASGSPYFAPQDAARRIILLGGGGYVLDAFGALHRFKIGAGTAPPLVKDGVYFSGQDIARDVAIKITTKDANNNPTGAIAQLLDCHGGITPISIGSAARPGYVNGFPYNPGRCDMHDITFIEWSKPSGLVVGGNGDFYSFGTYPAPPAFVNPQIGKIIGTTSRIVSGTRRYWVLSDYGKIRAYAGPNQPLFSDSRADINTVNAAFISSGRIRLQNNPPEWNDLMSGIDDGTAKFIRDLVQKGGYTIEISALINDHPRCSTDNLVSNHYKGFAVDISNHSASPLNDMYWWIYNNRSAYPINELFYVNFPNMAIDNGAVGTNPQTKYHTDHIHIAVGHLGDPSVHC